ncbi:MAG: PIN domain-containing protein [Candidatus Aenigmarchaeota archaeon]|nr:PIN domain-containing protein [Candidatus Aenigmarchaeota archaeon]
MLLIVDANIILSAVVTNGKAKQIFEKNKIFGMLDLYAPEYLSEQIEENALEIMKKSRLTFEEFRLSLMFVASQIKFVESEMFAEFLAEAEKISPPRDFQYVALSMYFKSRDTDASIWSNDKELAKVSGIKALTTHELDRLLISRGL